MILRLDPPFWLETPRGLALAHFLIDRGIEFDNEYICFHNNGEIWNWMNYDVRVAQNLTIGRRVEKMAKRYEGSPADIAKDKREAKKRGMSMKKWERSAADKKMDRAGQKRMSKGRK